MGGDLIEGGVELLLFAAFLAFPPDEPHPESEAGEGEEEREQGEDHEGVRRRGDVRRTLDAMGVVEVGWSGRGHGNDEFRMTNAGCRMTKKAGR